MSLGDLEKRVRAEMAHSCPVFRIVSHRKNWLKNGDCLRRYR